MEAMDKVILQHREDPRRTVQPHQVPIEGGTPAGDDDEGILKDYLRNSSFPVVRYVLGPELRVSLKVFWLAVGVCLVGVFGFTVMVCVERLRDPSNVFVGEAEKALPIWSVPFPAVTLCPRKGGCAGGIRLLEEFCDTVCWQDVCTNKCEKFLDPVRTERGICYTFNAVAGALLFNNNSLSNVRDLSNVTRLTENWDFLRGRQIINNVLVKQYPRAAQDVSGRYRLRVFIRNDVNESSIDCTTPSMDAFVHSPIDFPFKPVKPVVIPIGPALVQLSVHPKLVRSQRYLRYFTASTTGCISQVQNQLKYFTIYTQANCEMECHVNYFLQKRGCVLDHMPRTHEMIPCNGTFAYRATDVIDKNAIAQLRVASIPRSQFFRWKCNCLPACVEFRYRAEVSRFNLEFPSVASSNESEQASTQLVVEFAEDHFYPLVRVVRYGWLDFLADFGGLLALFLGVSIVTLLEIFFFCFMKPAVVR
uniref:Uncharacterized protein n=1 Tax=Anopheles atroparvus TaxID=41427 RepID=A0AAG5DKB3_ANOAO